MDYEQLLRELIEEKVSLAEQQANLDLAIEAVSRLVFGHACRSLLPQAVAERRGRKSMPPAEREEISKRMKRLWDDRRGKKLPGPSTAGVDLTLVKIPTGQPIS